MAQTWPDDAIPSFVATTVQVLGHQKYHML